MEREKRPLKAPDLIAIYGKPARILAGLASKAYHEDHSFIPGQVGPAELIVSTVLNPDDTVSEVLITRQNSLLPSTRTTFIYKEEKGRKILGEVENFLYFEEAGVYHPVEKIKEDGKPESQIPSEVKRVQGLFMPPKPGGKSPDFEAAFKEAEALDHPLIIVHEGDGSKVVILTRFYTIGDITYFGASLMTFEESPQGLRIKSMTRLPNLRGVKHISWTPDEIPTRADYIYDKKHEASGKRWYFGDEFLYEDTYYPFKYKIGETEINVFDVERFHPAGKKVAENFRFEDLLRDEQNVNTVLNVFGATYEDLGEKVEGGTFVRLIKFPNLPEGKQIKATIKVNRYDVSMGIADFELLKTELVEVKSN